MRVVFFGTPQFAVPCLEYLLANPQFEVVAAVTQPDKRRGRGAQTTPSPVKAVALDRGLPIFQPPRLRKATEVLTQLDSLQADLFVVVAYGQILAAQVLQMPRLGCINVHASLLPEYRGAAPIQWCLYEGKTQTGVTTMLMDEGMDTGPMLLKATVPIAPLETAIDLATKLSACGAQLLIETLRLWEKQTLQPTPQAESVATYARLIDKADYQLDWSRSALDLHNQVRGFFPQSQTRLRDQICKITATVPIALALPWQLPQVFAPLLSEWEAHLQQPIAEPGAIVGLIKGEGPLVQTRSGLLLIRKVQLAGKKPQTGWELANGLHLSIGETFTGVPV